MASLNHHHISLRASSEQLDLLLSILNAIHHILIAMQPKHRTLDIGQTSMQAISISQIHSRFAHPLPPRITCVILLDKLVPLFACGVRRIFAESNVDNEVAVVVRGGEVRSEFCGGEAVD